MSPKMPLPQPPVPLEDVCSAVYNNVLYTYSAEAFLSLPLTPGAQWKQLPSGVAVTGGACVGSTPKDDSQAGFFVVGGKGPTLEYAGLQKFTYSTGKWESIPLNPHVTQERLWHGVAYINSTDKILMYSGSQDGAKTESSQTFTISASAPFEVQAYESIAPPTINPILLPWSETQAVLIGGSEVNKKVMLFSAETGWVDSGASLAAPLYKNITAMKAVVVTADDGCKSLYTFDMTQSPNEVNRTVLINGQGAPVPDSVAITTRASNPPPAKKRGWSERRQALTETGWPQYNASLAPTATRSNYAVAEDPNGLVVIAGGNKDDILCLFDGRNNGWINASDRLLVQKVTSEDTPSNSTSTSASPTASATQSENPAAASTGPASSLNANAILGIALGAIVGLAMLLILIYICIRRKRRQQDFFEAGHNRRASGVASPEKGGFAYASDSLPQGPALGTFRGHQHQDSQNSFSSMAILMGRVNQQKPAGLQRNNSKETKRSSMDSNFKTALKSTISKPIPHSGERNLTAPAARLEPKDERGVSFGPNVADPRPRGPKPDRQGSTRRSSGWNRYWSGGSALNILGFGNRHESKRATVDSDQSSHYSADAHRITQDSATVPPLHITQMAPPEPRPKFQRVNSGSPTMASYDPRVKDEMRAQIERPISHVSGHSGYSSGIPASVHDAWDPTSANKPWGVDRAPTGAYTGIFTSGLTPASSSSGKSGPPSGVSRQPQLTTAATSSDMSWLNLGDNRRL